MTTQFLAIAPRGRFDQQSLELMTGENGSVLVRILDNNRMLALAVPLDLLQQQVAQLRVTTPTKNGPARVLFSPLPAAETRPETALGSSGVEDAAGSPTGAASVPPHAAAPAQGGSVAVGGSDEGFPVRFRRDGGIDQNYTQGAGSFDDGVDAVGWRHVPAPAFLDELKLRLRSHQVDLATLRPVVGDQEWEDASSKQPTDRCAESRRGDVGHVQGAVLDLQGPHSSPPVETPRGAEHTPDVVEDTVGSPADAAASPSAAASAKGVAHRPLPAAVTGPEAAPSPSATPRTEPARVTPADIHPRPRPRFPGARRDPNTPTGQRWSPL